MIRVGFVCADVGDAWLGGFNYTRNLLRAIRSSQRIEPVILTACNLSEALVEAFPNVEIVPTALLGAGRRTLARKVAEKLYGRAFLFERLLRERGIDVLSHSGHLGPRSRFPTIGWIPDFQHMRLPEFFSAGERRSRDGMFRRLADYSTRLVVSSEDAHRDLIAFRGQSAHKARVLHFVPGLGNAPREAPRDVLKRYAIEPPFFHLPNQFWAHKNHAVVIDAVKRARGKGRRLCVVATGRTHDPRNPDHFARLMRRLAESGCGDDFKALGLVPFEDVVALMQLSVALINPSLFEGWSTTVEEAKSLGKTILLSDIPVHREQNPEYGRFFDARDPDGLADLMIEALDAYSPEREAAQAACAGAALPARVAAFARAYEEIALEAAEARE